MTRFEMQRARMVRDHLASRGIESGEVLRAMGLVPREAFVPPELAEFAYNDAPLPLAGEQTISQPFIVASMLDAAHVAPADLALEIGAGSGYAAAVLSRIAAEVVSVERLPELAGSAQARLAALGYDNVRIVQGDGTLGWAPRAPYDVIIVSAGGPSVPRPLLEQLAPGGRLVIPVGPTPRSQQLIRVTREADGRFSERDLGGVQFVPLIGQRGWADAAGKLLGAPARGSHALSRLIRETAEPIDDIESAALEPLLARMADARVVLLGEATHGSSEFYRMRSRITRELVLRHGFDAVAVEADWPDAAVVDRYVRHLPRGQQSWQAFSRFPTWMWRNREVHELVEWLRAYNGEHQGERALRLFGLDPYSLYTSADVVIRYLERVDPAAAAVARERYGALSPWQTDPAAYGRAVLRGRYRDCEEEVVAQLRELLAKRLEYAAQDGDDFFDALGNARLVAGAERYYRVMYYGSVESWNLRDQHMFDTLLALMHEQRRKVVVWEHNSHVGDARATEMAASGEHNVGSLCREHFGDGLYTVGFGTDSGTVAAASGWDEPMQVMRVHPALTDSYEGVLHRSGLQAGLLHLKRPRREVLRDELSAPRLERAIGVVYRPDTELQSHYFQAVLPRQFDEYVWFDRTSAVTPLPSSVPHGVPDTYSFGL